jgi:hypothetical protein
MSTPSRRAFLAQAGAGAAAAAVRGSGSPESRASSPQIVPIDFRYAPRSWQTAFCFPDDRHKSLVGERGELRCGHPGTGYSIDWFSAVVRFSAAGMEPDTVERQELEAPGVPIVHTFLDRPEAKLELVAFATERAGEGRVDNVLVYIRPKAPGRRAAPVMRIQTREALESASENGRCLIRAGDRLFAAASCPMTRRDTGRGGVFTGPAAPLAGAGARFLFRFPQERQAAEAVVPAMADPDALLAGARAYWSNWLPFGGDVQWQLPRHCQNFLVACARNILQAREVKEGRKTFQVGPTVYRGLWVVDGNFLLEAARYLGYDQDARQGLEAIWAKQQPDGSVVAAVTGKHWKDTAIAMFTLSRQAELSQDWALFRDWSPNLLRAAGFLERLTEQGKSEASANGRYGILPRGFGDGGLGGERSEFTNTVWALAGLHATLDAARRADAGGFAPVRAFHDRLRKAFFAAARQEMRRHPAGFEYLPMLMREDPAWHAPDEWDRPRPQNAQWALSHAIYPGLVFEKDDPIVRGHVALMQACTREDIPAGTGWLPHEGLWNYNAGFVAEVYLWAGLAALAGRTFAGFLNHAAPLYGWREEQPLRNSLVAGYVGDMPHNWASAECVRYLRHMAVLEDGGALRLWDGITGRELAAREPTVIGNSPTRFGRVSVRLEPGAGGREWTGRFRREDGPPPAAVRIPMRLGARFEFASLEGAACRQGRATCDLDPAARQWSVKWVRRGAGADQPGAAL